LLQFHQTLQFRRYTEAELQHILESRVGTKVIAADAIKLICKKVAKSSGDVRAALDMTADAVQYRLKQLQDHELNAVAILSKPLVSIREHVASAKLTQDDLAGRIRDIPLFGKIVLCVLVTLALEGVQFAKVMDLRVCVTDCLDDFPDELQAMSSENFQLILETLVDQNVLKMDSATADSRSRLSAASYQLETVRLGTQLQDVCEVVKTELVEKQGFWAKIEDRARAHWKIKRTYDK
jgi:hypothetical protein